MMAKHYLGFLLIILITACSKEEVKKEYYPKGQLREIITYENGQFHGLYEAFYENGQIRARGNYKKGEKFGVWIDWYDNGEKMFEASYDSKGLINLKAWDKKGKQTIENCTGVAYLYYPNGKPMSRISYKDCMMDGEWKTWFENGEIQSEFYYEKGIPIGIWKFWNDDGTLQKAENYAGGFK